MDMKDRISFLIAEKKISKTEFAKSIKVSQAFVSQMCAGVANPSDRTIELICQQYGCDEVWLRTGEGEPFRQESRQEQIMRFAVQTVKGSSEFRKALVAMLATLDDSEWDGLEKLLDKLLEQYKKD